MFKRLFSSLTFVSLFVGASFFVNQKPSESVPINYVSIGNINFDSYCQQRWPGSQAGLLDQTAWGWRCFINKNSYPIIFQDACNQQHPQYTRIISEPQNLADPYSWQCFVSKSPSNSTIIHAQ